MGFRLRLSIALIIIAIAIILLTAHSSRLLINHKVLIKTSNATNQIVAGSPISIDVPIYVVGPLTLVQRLVSVGVNESLIRPVTISELLSLPGNSLVVIDWSVIGPNLIINRSGLIRVNASSTSFKLIRELIRRGDFLIIHGNASEAPAIELALATAWASAFNASVMAIPVPKYLNGLDYVIAYGNSHVLVIGPHSLNDALNIASKYWIPMIMKISTPDPTPPDDLCAEIPVLADNQPFQISSTAYAIVYGPQAYSDSLGLFEVDFCLSWSAVTADDVNGYSAGYAELFNYIYYLPYSGTQIEYLKTFQDGYASYVVYEFEMGYISASQLPRDVQVIAGAYPGGTLNPGYWTNTIGFEPKGISCTPSTTYMINLATGFSATLTSITVSSSTGQTYSCPEYTIFVYGNTGAVTTMHIGTVNQTWIFTPQATQYAEEEQDYGVDSQGYTYMGSAYSPQSSAYTIPAGSSVVVNETGGCTYYVLGFIPVSGTLVEHIVYDINWDVWVNSNGAMSSSSYAVYIAPPAYSSGWNSNNGFYYTYSCSW